MEIDIITEEMKQGMINGKNIEELTEEDILSNDTFNFIFSTDNIFVREDFIRKIQSKAKMLKIKPNFDRILRQYERQINKEERRQNNSTKPKHNEIAEILLKNENIVLHEKDLYIYENGVYKNNKEIIERKVIEIIEDATIRFRTEVYKYLQLVPNIKKVEIDRESNIINFKNGLLNLKTGALNEHTSDFFSINQINTNFNPNAEKVQAIDDVLDKLSNGVSERKQTILEMIGYCMTTSVEAQKAFILYGNKAQNGKSTLLNIINELIGRDNVSCVSFKDLNTNRFASSIIKNKILNSGTEMPNDYIEDISKIKAWITGDYITIEEKGKQMEEIVPYAKFIFNANELPRVADKTNGFYRRLQIIPLEYSFTNKDRKVFNFNELVSDKALEYLAKIAIEAYMNMDKIFSNYEESEKEVSKYKIETNSVLSFINDEEYIMPFLEVSTSTRYASEVYKYYKNYCIENQWRPIGLTKFYNEIEKSKLILTIGKSNNQRTYTFNRDFYKNNP